MNSAVVIATQNLEFQLLLSKTDKVRQDLLQIAEMEQELPYSGLQGQSQRLYLSLKILDY